MRMMKCRWKHCSHGGEVAKDEAVKDGVSYYHKDCYEQKKAFMEIVDVFHQRVDPHPIEKYLRFAINKLVFEEDVDPRFLLFALNYCLDHGWNLHHPAGLKSVVKNTDAQKAWKEKQDRKLIRGLRRKTSIIDDYVDIGLNLPELPNVKQNSNNKNKFSSVLGV